MATRNLALASAGGTATASSVHAQHTTHTADQAIDGLPSPLTNQYTDDAWESAAGSDPQWLRIDLGAAYALTQAVIYWDPAARASSYQLQTSTNGTDWTDQYTTTTGSGTTDTINFTANARYVRMYGTVRNSAYAYFIMEMQVWGDDITGSTPVTYARRIVIG